MTIYQQQCLLGYLGYSVGVIDGIYGNATRNALKQFQTDYLLPTTGVSDDATEKMLIGVVAGTVAKKEKQAISDKASDNVGNKTGTFWDSIRHFKREEFRCKCGGKYCNGYPSEMKEAVVRIADDAREHFGKPAHVVSGLRCKQHNANEGGVANSQHMYGEAIDLRIDGVDSETLRQYVSSRPGHRYSYRINDTNVHFDINPVGR